jgi:hypothetical protein
VVGAEGGQRGDARPAAAHRIGEAVQPGSAALEEEVFLRGEVVEDRLDGDIGLAGDVRDGHRVEPTVGEHPLRHRADLLAGPRLLARSTVHQVTHSARICTQSGSSLG